MIRLSPEQLRHLAQSAQLVAVGQLLGAGVQALATEQGHWSTVAFSLIAYAALEAAAVYVLGRARTKEGSKP